MVQTCIYVEFVQSTRVLILMAGAVTQVGIQYLAIGNSDR